MKHYRNDTGIIKNPAAFGFRLDENPEDFSIEKILEEFEDKPRIQELYFGVAFSKKQNVKTLQKKSVSYINCMIDEPIICKHSILLIGLKRISVDELENTIASIKSFCEHHWGKFKGFVLLDSPINWGT